MVDGIHSKDTYVNLDSVDISTYCNNLAINDEVDEVETTGFGDTSKKFVGGFRDINATLSGNYGDADGSGIATQLAALRTSGEIVPLIYGPAGDEAGNVRETYDAQVMSFNKTSAIGAAVTFSCKLRLSNPAVGTFS